MIDKINDLLIKKYLSYCRQLNSFDKERVEYALTIILDEMEKIITIFFIFILIGRVKMFLLSFIVLMSLRIFIGGVHFSTRSKCFFFSLLFFLVTVLMSEKIIIDRYIGLFIGLIAIVNIVLYAPLPSKHRILVEERRKKHLRKCALVEMIGWMFCYILIMREISNVIIWTVLMQQLEIVIYRFVRNRKERKTNDNN